MKYQQCKCGYEQDNYSTPEQDICPACKRVGCWDIVVVCDECEKEIDGKVIEYGDGHFDEDCYEMMGYTLKL